MLSPFLLPLRTMSMRVPRPKNWRTSPLDAPKPLAPPRPPRFPAPAPAPTPNLRDPPPPPPPHPHPPRKPPRTPHEHAQHRLALRRAFPAGWAPPRTLSRTAMAALRALHRAAPETHTTPALAAAFRVSPEAVRRILRSRWVPSAERGEELRARDEVRRRARGAGRVRREWEEGVGKGVLRYTEERLELT